MNKELREEVDTLLYGLEHCGHDRGYVLDIVTTTIHKATLAEVKDALNNLKRVKEKTMLGRPLHSEYIETIDNLRGKDEANAGLDEATEIAQKTGQYDMEWSDE